MRSCLPIPRTNTLKVFGRMDRFTGDIMIFERTPEEEAKMKAGQSSKAAIVIKCIVLRRCLSSDSAC